MPFDYQPVLHGDLVTLRPLLAGDHDALYAVADPLIWEQHPDQTRHQAAGFQRFFQEALASGGALIASETNTEQVIGSSRFHAYDPDRDEVEIGWTFLALVDEHIRCENRHDLDAVMATFGADARFDDEPWSDRRTGRASVRSYYTDLLRALPELLIEVVQRHAAGDSIVVEVIIRGTHLGAWRGLPATGRRVQVPLCGVYTFDAADRLAGERIYYDRAAVLHQLGFFHEPVTGLGRVITALTHPVSIARAGVVRLTGISPKATSDAA